MAGDLDGLGDAATGVLAASAVSRGHARHSASADIEHGLCLNCGSGLRGDYCHACGQSAHIHRSMRAFFHDLLHGVLHVEGRTWRTLPLLAWRPGELTRRYVHGERALFVSPLALFLFAVFLLFAVASMAGGEPDLSGARPDVAAAMADEARTIEGRIAALRNDIAGGGLDPADLARTRAELAEAEQAQRTLMTAYRTLSGGDGAGRDTPLSQRPVVDASADELQALERSWLGRKLVAGVRKARENPSLVFYKVKTNAYKFGWALIPLSAPFVWLVMVGRRMRERHFYDHVVFTTYSIAFMMLLLIALIVAGLAGAPEGMIAMIAIVYPPFHMYRQLRGAYRLSRVNALIRTTILLLFSLFALSVFVTLLVTAGLIA